MRQTNRMLEKQKAGQGMIMIKDKIGGLVSVIGKDGTKAIINEKKNGKDLAECREWMMMTMMSILY